MKGFSKRTLNNLKGVDPRLVMIVFEVIRRGNVDLTVIDGFRDAQTQYQLFLDKKSKCDGTHKKSYHQSGKAVDFIYCPFDNKWDKNKLAAVGEELKKVAKEYGIECEYGGDWGWDYPHFQIK